MTFLELCQRARKEAGITGAGPTSVLNQSGQLGRLVGWVATAWEDIQLMRPDWLFMNSEFTFNTIADTRDYLAADSAITDMKLWDTGSFMIYDPAIGFTDQNTLPFQRYKRWRANFRNQMQARPSDRPQLFTELPGNKIRFEPMPDKVYTIDGEYKRLTQVLAADTDVPTGFPDDFHLMIVWKALQYYAFYENGPEVLDQAETSFGNLLIRLEIEQLPEFSEDYQALA